MGMFIQSVISGTLGAALLALTTTAPAQVTYFSEPPSVEQLQRALQASDQPPTDGKPRIMARGIEWKITPQAGANDGTPQGPQNTGGATRELGASNQGGGTRQPAGQANHSAPDSAAQGSGGSAGGSGAAGGGDAGKPAIAVPINFDVNSAQVNRASLQYIDAIAELLNREPRLRLLIEGHTDASGDPQYNLVLSWDRAFTVFKTLVQRYGIDPSRLQPLGKGSSEPLQGTQPTAGVNRRVQFRPLS